MIYALLTALLLFSIDATASTVPSHCDGQVVEDLSDVEKTLPFSPPDIEGEYTGYVAHFQVVDSDGKRQKKYDRQHLLDRALSYSAAQCAPREITYPDLQLVIGYYEQGALTAQSILVNGGKILARRTEFGPNGNVQSEYSYKDGLIQGLARFYHPNGKLNYTLSYEEGLRNGCFESHYPDKEPKANGCFNQDHLVDRYQFFFPNGQLEVDSFYNPDGQLEGSYREYYEDGQPKTESHYIDGVLTAEYTEYFPDGALRAKTVYDEGNIVGTGYVYFQDGSIEEIYINEPDGHHTKYYDGGSTRSTVPIAGGFYHGDYIEYYPDGPIRTTARYDQGLVVGTARTLTESGGLISVSEYLGGTLLRTTDYYDHGGVQSVASYDVQGRLINRDLYNEVGAVETSIPYQDDQIHGVMRRYYRDGSVSAEVEFQNGQVINPLVAYRSDGSELFRINYAQSGDIAAAAVYNLAGQIRHFVQVEDGTTTQYELYADESTKLISVIDASGNEAREFYAYGQDTALMTQTFATEKGLTQILYDTGDVSVGCVMEDNAADYICGTIDNSSGNVELMNTDRVLGTLSDWIEEDELTKPDIASMIDMQTGRGLLSEENNRIAESMVDNNSAGQNCYDLGFTEYCE